MFNRYYFYDKYKQGGRQSNDVNPIETHRRGSTKITTKNESGVNVWVIRISIIVAILLLISFYFIPFPINLILFIITLIAFLIISFWVHIRVKRQSQQDSSNSNYSSNRLSGDQTFVDVPLEPITVSDNGVKPQFERI